MKIRDTLDQQVLFVPSPFYFEISWPFRRRVRLLVARVLSSTMFPAVTWDGVNSRVVDEIGGFRGRAEIWVRLYPLDWLRRQ